LGLFENRMLGRIFGLKRQEVKGRVIKQYNEGLRNFYSSPNVINVIKLRKIKWAVHVAGMEKVQFLLCLLSS
jgi:hypothetical protein